MEAPWVIGAVILSFTSERISRGVRPYPYNQCVSVRKTKNDDFRVSETPAIFYARIGCPFTAQFITTSSLVSQTHISKARLVGKAWKKEGPFKGIIASLNQTDIFRRNRENFPTAAFVIFNRADQNKPPRIPGKPYRGLFLTPFLSYRL